MTLTDYVNQQRIAHAQHLLLNTSFPIKSIAQQCGEIFLFPIICEIACHFCPSCSRR